MHKAFLILHSQRACTLQRAGGRRRTPGHDPEGVQLGLVDLESDNHRLGLECASRWELDPMGFPLPMASAVASLGGVVGEVLSCGPRGSCGAPRQAHGSGFKVLFKIPRCLSYELCLPPAIWIGQYACLGGATWESDVRGSFSGFQAGEMLSVQQDQPSVTLPPPLSKGSHPTCVAPHIAKVDSKVKKVHSAYGFEARIVDVSLFNVFLGANDWAGSYFCRCMPGGFHARARFPIGVDCCHVRVGDRPVAPGGCWLSR